MLQFSPCERLACALVILTLHAAAAVAAGDEENPAAVSFSNPVKQRWQIGFVVEGQGGPCSGITATAPVPMDWPEQSVRIVSEEISPQVRSIRYRTLEDGVRQMVVTIPRLGSRDKATALVTFEVAKSNIEGPRGTSGLLAPKRPPRALRKFLGPSPMIESSDRRIRALAEELVDQDQPAWEQAGAIFDWVRANVKYEFDPELKGALTALEDGKGDCEELTSLFIALCRAQRIPARAVWVPGHCYPEFYLEDGAGNGHWYPCQAAGEARDFGRMPESRPILQKGDNFRVPGERKPQRYVKQSLTAANASVNPRVESYLRQVDEKGLPVGSPSIDAP